MTYDSNRGFDDEMMNDGVRPDNRMDRMGGEGNRPHEASMQAEPRSDIDIEDQSSTTGKVNNPEETSSNNPEMTLQDENDPIVEEDEGASKRMDNIR